MALRRKRKLIFSALSILFLFYVGKILINNQMDFCVREMRALSDQEIIDSFLFGSKYKNMSLVEKKNAVQNKSAGVYPECCHLMRDDGWHFGNSYPYELTTYFPRTEISKENDPKNPEEFYEEIWQVNKCGEAFENSRGISMSKKNYFQVLDAYKKK